MSYAWPSDGDDLDALVSEFGEAAGEEGETRALFANLICGLPWYEDSLRQFLHASRRLLSAWDRSEWTVRSFPLTLTMMRGMAGLALSLGWYLEATALLVGYDGLLRIMELLRIRAKDVQGDLGAFSLVLELPDTKTSSRKSTGERAILTCPMACLLLKILCEDLEPGDFVFGTLSAKVFRSRLRDLAARLGLADLFITPHSLRRGSATHLFRLCGSFDQVASSGIWENIRTCRKYIDEAVAELSHFELQDHAKLKAAEYLLLEFFG